MGRIVIAAYRPKPGQREALLALTASHVPRLRAEGLVTTRDPIIMEAGDGTVIEVFEWESEAAIERAHSNSAVEEMWRQYNEVCTYVPMAEVAEAKEPFSGFSPLPTEAAHHHHSVDYFELTTTDLEASKAFYAAAFGWSFNDYGLEYAGIRRTTGPGEVGGLRAAPAMASGGDGAPLVILFSADLDASIAAVASAGGTISTPPFDFPGGRRFHFRDPSGNELAVWAEPG